MQARFPSHAICRCCRFNLLLSLHTTPMHGMIESRTIIFAADTAARRVFARVMLHGRAYRRRAGFFSDARRSRDNYSSAILAKYLYSRRCAEYRSGTGHGIRPLTGVAITSRALMATQAPFIASRPLMLPLAPKSMKSLFQLPPSYTPKMMMPDDGVIHAIAIARMLACRR